MNRNTVRIRGAELKTFEGRHVRGIIPYGSQSHPIYDHDGSGYIESIEKGAFTKSLLEAKNIRALYHHDPADILASTKNNSLHLEDTEFGLVFEFNLPETTLGEDMLRMIKEGLVDGCSFGCRVIKDKWNGTKSRTIKEAQLYEVSLCPQDQAYPDSNVMVRALSEVYEGQEISEDNKVEIQAEIAKLNSLLGEPLDNKEEDTKADGEAEADGAVVETEEPPVVEETATPSEPTVDWKALYDTLKADSESKEAEWNRIYNEIEASFNSLKEELKL